MRIYINGRFFSESVTGIQKYALSVLGCMDQLVKDDLELILLLPPDTVCSTSFKNIRIEQKGRLHGNLWEQFELPFFAWNGFLLNLCNRAPLAKKSQTIVIYDAAICATPERFSRRFRWFLQGMYYLLGQRLNHIITISIFAKEDICRYFHIPRQKVSVAYAGSEHIQGILPENSILQRFQLNQSAYILSVGGTLNKNFAKIVAAMPYLSDVEVTLVVVGQLEDQCRKLLDGIKNVCIVGYVTNEELMALYTKAKCLVFPSVYEGFGIPPLEAMSMGCPVIVSNRASLPEVCGEAALYCDPFDEKDIANQIRILLCNEDIVMELKRRGYLQVKKFSWMDTAEKILRLCH